MTDMVAETMRVEMEMKMGTGKKMTMMRMMRWKTTTYQQTARTEILIECIRPTMGLREGPGIISPFRMDHSLSGGTSCHRNHSLNHNIHNRTDAILIRT